MTDQIQPVYQDHRDFISDTLAPKVADVEETPLNGGTQIKIFFENGYGASIIRGPFTYGGSEGLFELAVVGKHGHLDFNTPVTDDVIGWLRPDQVVDLLEQIAGLTEKLVARHVRVTTIEKTYKRARSALEQLPPAFNRDRLLVELDRQFLPLFEEATAYLESDDD